MTISSSSAGPHFLGIGVQRGATGWVFRHLIQHPDVWMPPLKELHYFDVIDPILARPPYRYGQNLKRRLLSAASSVAPRLIPTAWQKKVKVVWDPAWDLRYFVGRSNMDWYARLFSHAASQGKVTGEITPEYCMLSPQVVQQIAETFPDVRPFIILRDPIDRSWSSFQLAVRHTARTQQVDDAARCKRFKAFVSNDEDHLNARLDYARSIEMWRSAFPGDRLLVTSFDRMRADPSAFLTSICTHIGIDTTKVPADPGLRVNSHQARVGHGLPNYAEATLAERALPHLRQLAKVDLEPSIQADIAAWTQRAELAIQTERRRSEPV